MYGELILANLYIVPKNHKLTVLNYYDPEQKEISIPLKSEKRMIISSMLKICLALM